MCVYVYVYVYMYIYIYIYLSIYPSICLSIYLSVYIQYDVNNTYMICIQYNVYNTYMQMSWEASPAPPSAPASALISAQRGIGISPVLRSSPRLQVLLQPLLYYIVYRQFFGLRPGCRYCIHEYDTHMI